MTTTTPKLIAGLGNPGPEHDRTRHNVGFEVLDRLARRLAPGSVARSRFHGALIETRVGDQRLLLLRPTTYMNRSGQSVGEAIRYHRIDPSEGLLVIVDDMALSCGTLRLRPDGSDGGHHGLADIARHLDQESWSRLRVGIDEPGEVPGRSWVLGRFSEEQRQRLDPALVEAVLAAECWVHHGIETAMNRHNRTVAS